MIIQGQVGNIPNTSIQDGIQPILLAGKSGEVIMSQLHGKYYSQTYRGNSFTGSTAAAGIVLPALAATAQTFVIWNPAGSTKNIIPIRFSIGMVSVSTPAAGVFCLGYTPNAGSQASTAAKVTAITTAVPINTNINSGVSSIALFAPATATFTAAFEPTALPGPLWSVGAGAVSLEGLSPTNFDMEGQLIIAPGSLITLNAVTATGVTMTVTALWVEVPV